MATLEIKFRGRPSAQKIDLESDSNYEEVQTFEVHPLTRGDIPEVSPIQLSEEDLIQLKLTDDTFWIGDKDTLEELFPQKLTRSANQNELYLPDFLEMEATDRNAVKKIGIQLFSIFKKKKAKVQEGMRFLAKKVENKQLSVTGIDFEQEGAGLLCHVEKDFTLSRWDTKAIGKKALLFLHGTGSSTAGSFAELNGAGKNPAWDLIYESYGAGSVLALQHRTLTASPLENVLDLIRQLPAEIELDVVTHSRGGLVGDVLARFTADSRGFDPKEKLLLEQENRDDVEVIEQIQKEIQSKKITVRNMVRVACPANGTTLASKRMDYLLNILFNLIGTVTAQATNPIFQTFRELIMTAVNSKNNPESLPGLESMNPDSPFIKALNYQGTEIQIDSLLHVVGGSSELSLELKGLIVLAGKLFFRGQNDLVVDTESMKWGTPRKEGKASVFIDQSKKINHIVYFGTAETQQRIFQALQENTASSKNGFQPIRLSKKEDQDRGLFGIEGGKTKMDKVSGKRPILVLLPGIMGSNISVNDDLVWINYARFLGGQLTRLKNDPKNNRNVKAHSLVKTSYGKLADYLSKSYDVVTFPYDWRMPLPDSAKMLNDKLEELMAFRQPIKIVAHSMGGVLVRDFILQHEESWKRLNATPGFRVLFLGSPLGGSYRIPFVLFGQDDIIKLLAKIDISNSVLDLLSVFSQFPGLLNLLPIQMEKDQPDFSQSKTWEDMRKAFGNPKWPIPSKEVLEEFGKYQALVAQKSRDIDYSNCYYIAGQSGKDKVTVNSYEIQANGKLKFYGTQEGDESVTWATGIPSQIAALKQLYYANVSHGGLTTQSSVFGPIEEILQAGKTSSLANQLPKLRSGVSPKIEPKVEEIYDLSEENVENVLLGLSAKTTEEEGELPIKVTISNGHLKFSSYPVLAGHFELDAILTTEKAIDRELDGELNKLQELGLYPGAIGSNQIILSENQEGFKGTVVIGLGTPGELSSYQLMLSVEKGISRYLTILNYSSHEEVTESPTPVGITVIAIANSFGGLSTDTSIRAILLGIQRANRKIKSVYKAKLKIIEEVEIIEIYHDKALSILKTVKGLQEDSSGEYKISLKNRALELKPGRRQRIPYENSSDWWTRINVSQEENTACGKNQIKMALATSGASQKVEYLKVNTKNLQTLLKEMTEENRAKPEIAKTMFELLVPLDFKEELKRQSNISWVVDEMTASFPWEMLQEDIQAKPLAIYSGMVRQLATEDYRKITTKSAGNHVLVVGDPILDGFLPQLPQAKKEGELVADFLQGKGFEVKREISSSASKILLELFSQEYKIIHLAAHGIFNPDPEEGSGVVIGNDAFISVQEIAQMSTVPELVFVNCCYLGKVDAEGKRGVENRNRLAANIGTQLIRNGVKAVVVAGWAVDDQAALDFCQKFYQELFQGVRFGEAVRRARQEIYNNSKDHTNTWGAYQCYGDPFYELKGYGVGSADSSREFLVKEEAELELQNLIQLLESKGIESQAAALVIEELEAALKKADVRSEKITELFAELYAKIGDYGRAIPYFTNLFNAEQADFSFRSMEQLCNISCKHAVQVFSMGPQSPEDLDWALKEIDNSIERLQGLIKFGVTSERMSLLGSALKRKLMVLPKSRKEEIVKTLSEAADAYQKASEIKKHLEYYPLVNWIQLIKVQSLVSESKELAQSSGALLDYLDTCEKAELARKAASDPWAFFVKANILLAKLVLEDGRTKTKEVLSAFLEALDRVGAASHVKAQEEHLDILISSLKLSADSDAKRIRAKLEEIRKEYQNLKK